MPKDYKNTYFIDKCQVWYGHVVHWVTIIACLLSLITPVLILLFPSLNILNPNVVFGAVFEGKKGVEIWAAAGTPFKPGDFWPLLFKNLYCPDGLAILGISLGCSVTFWSLMPAVWILAKRKEYFYSGISLFVMALIALAMSGLIQMAG